MKWLSVYAALMEAMRSGALKPTDSLPSTRDLARLHQCHRFTVMHALQALATEGWLEARERSRYVVSRKTPLIASASGAPARASEAFAAPIVRPHAGEDMEQTRHRLEFWGGQPDLRLFPLDDYRKIMATALRNAKGEQLSYGAVDGLPFMRQQTESYLRRTRNLVGKDIIVTNGAQEALALIAQVFLGPGDAVGVEAKGYPPAWKLFANAGAQVVPVAVDDEGLVTDDLANHIARKRIKLIYVTPLHQYPTTVTLSPRRRQELIRLAEMHRIPILEDDYDHEFHYTSPPPSPLAAETAYAVYVCSFSKVLFPGTRLGVVACDPAITRHLAYQKYLTSRQTHCLSQLALAHWLREGGFERHLRRMRRAYENRLACLVEELESLRRHHEVSWQTPSGGMSLWLDITRDSSLVAARAQERGVFFQTEQSLDYAGRVGRHLRIGFACVNEREIAHGMRVLRDALGAKTAKA